ncbi:Nucleotidyltransferase, putative (modular protein) [Verrucomicrobia bacterium]|nr:Nucleotidyltransferase, putative (modular protein) [Verrucomicrobiota bacterium]
MVDNQAYMPDAPTSGEGALREMPTKVQFDRERLGRLCRERGIVRLDLFGSALREDLGPDSDVDLLATVGPKAAVTLLDWADIQERLAEIFGRSVDLVSRRAIERSQNPYRREAILSTAVSIYVEG